MKKTLFLFSLFPFMLFAVTSAGFIESSDLIPVSVSLPVVDSSGNFSISSSSIEVSSWDDVYQVLYNSTISISLNSSLSNINLPQFPPSTRTNEFFTSRDVYRWVACKPSPSCPFSFTRCYFSPTYDSKCSSLLVSGLALYHSGFSSSNLSLVNKTLSFNPSLLFPEVLSSPTSLYRDTLLSTLSSVYSSVNTINTSIQSIDSVLTSLLSDYSSVNSFSLDDFSSLSNLIYSSGLSSYIIDGNIANSLLESLNTSNWDFVDPEGLDSYNSFRSSVVDGILLARKLQGLSQVLNSSQISTSPISRLLSSFGRHFNSSLNASLPGIADSFGVHLDAAFSNNWQLATNSHNVVNQALQNITNFIMGADLGTIERDLQDIKLYTHPLLNSYQPSDSSIRVFVTNPSDNDSIQADLSSLNQNFGGFFHEGDISWGDYTVSMANDLDELISLVRGFRYDFNSWVSDWSDYHIEAKDHFQVHLHYTDFITNFVNQTLDPFFSSFQPIVEEYTNLYPVVKERLDTDLDLANSNDSSTLGAVRSMLSHIPSTEDLISNVQELTNVVDLSARPLIDDALSSTNSVSDSITTYFKSTSLPDSISFTFFGDKSFSIPVSEKASLWSLIRNGLGFGLFIVNVLLFPKFLLKLLRLLFGAVDSFYATQPHA